MIHLKVFPILNLVKPYFNHFVLGKEVFAWDHVLSHNLHSYLLVYLLFSRLQLLPLSGDVLVIWHKHSIRVSQPIIYCLHCALLDYIRSKGGIFSKLYFYLVLAWVAYPDTHKKGGAEFNSLLEATLSEKN